MEEQPFLTNSSKPAFTFDRSSSYSSAIAFEVCGGVVAHVIFAIIFGVFLYNPIYYNPQCLDSLLYIWAEANLYYFIIASILTTLVSPLMIWISKIYENSHKCCYRVASFVHNFIRFSVGSMAIFLWGGLCVAYFKTKADCGQLGTLVFSYIIIVLCTIVVGCLILIALCCMFYVNKKTRRSHQGSDRTQEFGRMNLEV